MSGEKCSDKHDTLYHYTSMDGFRGIIETQTLWATHYQHLNDSSELKRFAATLPTFLVPIIKRVIKGHMAEGLPTKRMIRQFGSRDDLAQHEAKALSNAFFEAAFTPVGDNTVPMFEPFITSFCSHLDDDNYTREHGLLSMWHSYGADGGIALVFDTAALEDCLCREAGEYGHSILNIGDIVYEGDDKAFLEEFGDLIEVAKDKTYQHFRGEDADFNDFLEPFLGSVARLKHRAFKEEREVRIVSMPWNERTQNHEQRASKKAKLEMVRQGRYGPIRYLALFDGESVPRVPIRKIIVGPHSEQQKRFEEIREAVKYLGEVEVTCSETPFIER